MNKTEKLKKLVEVQNANLQKTKKQLAQRLKEEKQDVLLAYGILAMELSEKDPDFKSKLENYVPLSKLSAKQRKLVCVEEPACPESVETSNNDEVIQ